MSSCLRENSVNNERNFCYPKNATIFVNTINILFVFVPRPYAKMADIIIFFLSASKLALLASFKVKYSLIFEPKNDPNLNTNKKNIKNVSRFFLGSFYTSNGVSQPNQLLDSLGTTFSDDVTIRFMEDGVHGVMNFFLIATTLNIIT